MALSQRRGCKILNVIATVLVGVRFEAIPGNVGIC